MYSKKPIFQTKKSFTLVWKNQPSSTLTWLTLKKKFLPKKIIMLTQKTNEKLFSHPLERTNFLPKEKNSYTYLTKYAISYDYQKKQFSKQKISYSFQKNKFLILAQKVKALHFRCVLNTTLLFFYFFTFYYFFNIYSTSFYFSSSVRFFYRS